MCDKMGMEKSPHPGRLASASVWLRAGRLQLCLYDPQIRPGAGPKFVTKKVVSIHDFCKTLIFATTFNKIYASHSTVCYRDSQIFFSKNLAPISNI